MTIILLLLYFIHKTNRFWVKGWWQWFHNNASIYNFSLFSNGKLNLVGNLKNISVFSNGDKDDKNKLRKTEIFKLDTSFWQNWFWLFGITQKNNCRYMIFFKNYKL